MTTFHSISPDECEHLEIGKGRNHSYHPLLTGSSMHSRQNAWSHYSFLEKPTSSLEKESSLWPIYTDRTLVEVMKAVHGAGKQLR